MRTIRVRNASILAKLTGCNGQFERVREIDFEIRTTKDSVRGFSLFIDKVKWLDVDLVGTALMDGDNYDNKKALFRVKNIKSNGCL